MTYNLDITVAGYINHRFNGGETLLIHHGKLNRWLPVGGHIEKNETPDNALRREVKEEVGLDIKFLQYPSFRRGNIGEVALPFYTNVHHIKEDHVHYCLIYLVQPIGPELITLEKGKILRAKWFSLDELDSSLITKTFDGVELSESVILTGKEAISLYNGLK